MNVLNEYEIYLKANRDVLKIPYVECVPELTEKIPVTYETTSESGTQLPPHPTWSILRDTNIKLLKKTKEAIIQSYQRSLPIKDFGRLRGNMEYLEDSWDIQIQPLVIKYAYLRGENVELTDSIQMKLRDKYLKVRVRYDGTKYAIINAIKTFYTISYA